MDENENIYQYFELLNTVLKCFFDNSVGHNINTYYTFHLMQGLQLIYSTHINKYNKIEKLAVLVFCSKRNHE